MPLIKAVTVLKGICKSIFSPNIFTIIINIIPIAILINSFVKILKGKEKTLAKIIKPIIEPIIIKYSILTTSNKLYL